MESILSVIGLAVATVLVVAVAVAWWEQTGGRAAARRTRHAPPPHPVSVDVHLDEVAAAPAPASTDRAARQAALGSAMARMARPAAAPAAMAWMDTEPIVAAGLQQRFGNRQAAPGEASPTGY